MAPTTNSAMAPIVLLPKPNPDGWAPAPAAAPVLPAGRRTSGWRSEKLTKIMIPSQSAGCGLSVAKLWRAAHGRCDGSHKFSQFRQGFAEQAAWGTALGEWLFGAPGSHGRTLYLPWSRRKGDRGATSVLYARSLLALGGAQAETLGAAKAKAIGGAADLGFAVLAKDAAQRRASVPHYWRPLSAAQCCAKRRGAERCQSARRCGRTDARLGRWR